MKAVPGNAHVLRMETINAWDEYVRGGDLRMQEHLNGQKPFLWIDESAERRQHIGGGEILVAPVIAHGVRVVPDGLIHDWIGGVFIRGATLETLSATALDYHKYKEFYRPVIIESKLLACSDSGQKYSIVWHRKVLFVDAAMQGEYVAHEVRLDSRHGYNVSNAVQLQQIENYGRPDQRLLPADTGDGFLWRLHNIARYEERDGGVYLELEAIVLSREIPSSLRFIMAPLISRLSINSLTTTLRQTRDAVNSLSANGTSPAIAESARQKQCRAAAQ
ncbi:MAG TPA: hypothetical protein VKY31_05295 [Terriglobia bacterium]|nr:hypothetical protein [Terriglobia bacterium]